MTRTASALLALVVAAGAAGCADDTPLTAPSLESRIQVDTPELRSAKADLGVEPCPRPRGAGSDLPDLTLACLGGGRETTLSEVGGPAVVSLWASWCVSCPDELPLFQRLHEEAGDRLDVLGIDYQDTRPGAALALLGETGATYPQLADPGGELAEHYRVRGLPGLLLLDADGQVTFLLQRVDDYAELVALVEDHTGVQVQAG
jgi:thiol-disulfide isomerase/thioredoxin